MLENSSVELKTLVLLDFTKRLIISKNPMEFLIKQELPKTKSHDFVEKVKQRIPEEIKKEIYFQPLTKSFEIPKQKSQPILRIPETRLPPQFAHLRPYAVTETQLDLGELNPLLADNNVKVIESNGPDKALIVRGGMGTKPTNIILTEQEISEIIQTFSKKSKIPAGEGAVKIVFGQYELSAIISEEHGSRFIIKKIPPAQSPAKRIY
ncbi:MAG: hypothetical protein QT10_C0004G0039 [archaeon GW2011_AR19]|nr:MAG: hypothetical protein QT10_C0004G0039 [archaeon GW2011_AR19]